MFVSQTKSNNNHVVCLCGQRGLESQLVLSIAVNETFLPGNRNPQRLRSLHLPGLSCRLVQLKDGLRDRKTPGEGCMFARVWTWCACSLVWARMCVSMHVCARVLACMCACVHVGILHLLENWIRP